MYNSLIPKLTTLMIFGLIFKPDHALKQYPNIVKLWRPGNLSLPSFIEPTVLFPVSFNTYPDSFYLER